MCRGQGFDGDQDLAFDLSHSNFNLLLLRIASVSPLSLFDRATVRNVLLVTKQLHRYAMNLPDEIMTRIKELTDKDVAVAASLKCMEDYKVNSGSESCLSPHSRQLFLQALGYCGEAKCIRFWFIGRWDRRTSAD